jgi:hypothetical protein
MHITFSPPLKTWTSLSSMSSLKLQRPRKQVYNSVSCQKDVHRTYPQSTFSFSQILPSNNKAQSVRAAACFFPNFRVFYSSSWREFARREQNNKKVRRAKPQIEESRQSEQPCQRGPVPIIPDLALFTLVSLPLQSEIMGHIRYEVLDSSVVYRCREPVVSRFLDCNHRPKLPGYWWGRGTVGCRAGCDRTTLGRGSSTKISLSDSRWRENTINTYKYNTTIHRSLSISYYNLGLYFKFTKGLSTTDASQDRTEFAETVSLTFSTFSSP